MFLCLLLLLLLRGLLLLLLLELPSPVCTRWHQALNVVN